MTARDDDLRADLREFPLSLADTHRIVGHLIHDGTRDGLLLGGLLNDAMGASARRRRAVLDAHEPATEPEAGCRHLELPDTLWKRLRAAESDVERLLQDKQTLSRVVTEQRLRAEAAEQAVAAMTAEVEALKGGE